MFEFLKKTRKDEYPLVPVLKGLYNKYFEMKFNETSEECKKKDLDKLISTIREDGCLKHLIGLSCRTAIYKNGTDGPVIHLHSDGKFDYYDYAFSSGGTTDYDKSIDNLDNSFLINFFKDPNKLRDNILEHIKKALYTQY